MIIQISYFIERVKEGSGAEWARAKKRLETLATRSKRSLSPRKANIRPIISPGNSSISYAAQLRLISGREAQARTTFMANPAGPGLPVRD